MSSQAQQLKPMVQTTWEAEIRRITILGQREQKDHGTPPSRPVAGCSGACLSSQVSWTHK
jgi:hypothetical protein